MTRRYPQPCATTVVMKKRSARNEAGVPEANWITVAELAARCSVTPATVYHWIADGTGPRVARTGRTGRGIRVPISEVTEWEQHLMSP
ncbi:helix-turn-helix domain-containing protein [Kitasatospora sp. NPDC002227]|uniref:helix-turn-helix transcriptional regulator n=1 Tax=Kitasatospora sp. NPDC002227 TaxID=3154773 RepID=UPI003325461B